MKDSVSNNIINKFFLYSNDLMCILDEEGKFIKLNHAWEDILSYKTSELEGKSYIDVVHPHDLESVLKLNKSVLEKPNNSGSLECRIRCKDGLYKWMNISITNLLHDNDINGILGSLRDISNVKKAEHAVIEKEHIYDALFHNLTSAISIYNVITNQNGKPVDYQFLSVNSSYEKSLARKESELVGRTLLEVYPNTEQVWLDAIEKVYSTGISEKLVDYAKEVDMYYELVIYRPQKDMIALIGNDVSENKRAERKLRENEEKYRTIVEGLNEAIYRMVLPEGTYEYFSPAVHQVFGYTVDEFLSNPLLIKKIIHPDYNEYFKVEFEKLLRGEISKTYEYKIIDPQGEERWIYQSNKGIFNEAGKLVAIEGLCRNITKRKKAEKDLIQSEAILTSTMESLNEGLLIVNSDGIIMHSNTRFKEMFSIPNDLLSSKDDIKLINYAKEQLTNPDLFTRNIEKIYNSNESTEELLYLKDKRIIERVSFPLQKGSPIKGRVWLFRDITQQKLSEESLIKYKTSVDHSMEGVFWMNREGEFIM